MTGLQDLARARDGWSMARRRDAERFRPLALALAAVLATVMLAGAIQLGNSITAMRRDVQDLTSDLENLAARRAQLEVRWNTATSRQIIMSRAANELDLHCPDAPGTIVVTAVEPEGRGVDWRRLWPLAMGDPVPAATASERRP
jgi:outer membrane murein-binding lipoprotein Lpp